jgi:hypothetical protein
MPELHDVKSFSEVHDYCDANMLGNSAAYADRLDILNAAQAQVDATIKKYI